MTRAPLRFLLVVLVLWVGVRAAILLPDWPGGVTPFPEAAAEPASMTPPRISPAPAPAVTAASPLPFHVAGQKYWPEIPQQPAEARAVQLATGQQANALLRPSELRVAPRPLTGISQPPVVTLSPPQPVRAVSSGWSISAWLLVRDADSGSSLAPGGTLGGSQAGARVTYALGGGFALSGRAYLPLRHRAGAELAAGIDWRPVPALPLNLLAERRQRLGREGRSAFALTLYGGASRNLTPRVRVDAYGQAGVVGLRSRDLFADGSLRLAGRIGPVELGAGAWGAAQPGAARLDAGPSLSWRLPVRDTNLRLQADWRFRIAGDAAPRSGPALTLAADF